MTTPLSLPDIGMTDICVPLKEYSKATRARVADAVRLYHNNAPMWARDGWYTRMDWSTEGARLSKKVSAALYKAHGIKADDRLLGTIGEIAASEREIKATYDLTHSLDWHPGDYQDRGSCYWGSYARTRVVSLPRWGACALRVYDDNGRGNGRCWILPTNRILGMFVTFNYYGACGTLEWTRTLMTAILAHHLGGTWESKPVELSVAEAYINTPTKYLFYRPDDTTERGVPLSEKVLSINRLTYSNANLNLIQYAEPAWANADRINRWGNRVYCRGCARRYPENEVYYGTDNLAYCAACFDRTFRDCDGCGYRQNVADLTTLRPSVRVCQTCLREQVFVCGTCGDRELRIKPVAGSEDWGSVPVRHADGRLHETCSICATGLRSCVRCGHRHDGDGTHCSCCRPVAAAPLRGLGLSMRARGHA